MARAFLAFALGAAIVAAAVGSEFSGENIVHLTGSNFEDKARRRLQTRDTVGST